MAEIKADIDISFHPNGRGKAQCAPDPKYPDGVDVVVPQGTALRTCSTLLPYPATECGTFKVHCRTCDYTLNVTAAGRPDDPKSVTFPCGMKLGPTGEYPRGKFSDSDTGALVMSLTVRDKTIILDFGKEVTWVGLSKESALAIGQSLVDKANSL